LPPVWLLPGLLPSYRARVGRSGQIAGAAAAEIAGLILPGATAPASARRSEGAELSSVPRGEGEGGRLGSADAGLDPHHHGSADAGLDHHGSAAAGLDHHGSADAGLDRDHIGGAGERSITARRRDHPPQTEAARGFCDGSAIVPTNDPTNSAADRAVATERGPIAPSLPLAAPSPARLALPPAEGCHTLKLRGYPGFARRTHAIAPAGVVSGRMASFEKSEKPNRQRAGAGE
jgi:hypothetical protein